MFEKLLELLKDAWSGIKPFFVVDAFETDVLVMPHEQATDAFGFDTRAAARAVGRDIGRVYL